MRLRKRKPGALQKWIVFSKLGKKSYDGSRLGMDAVIACSEQGAMDAAEAQGAEAVGAIPMLYLDYYVTCIKKLSFATLRRDMDLIPERR